MPAINVIIKPIEDEKTAARIRDILSKPSKLPPESIQVKELKRKIKFKFVEGDNDTRGVSKE